MRKVIPHFIFLFILIEGKAQEPLRLADAVNIALKNSLDVQLASNDLEANTIFKYLWGSRGHAACDCICCRQRTDINDQPKAKHWYNHHQGRGRG
jgi:hypothetical protein